MAVMSVAGRVPRRVSPFPPARPGSSGFLTEPGCVTAAWPREPSGVLKHARRRCRPRSGCPRVPAASSAWVVGRLSQEKEKRERVPRAAGGRPPPPLPPLLRWLSEPHRRLLRSEPPRPGASVAGSRPPRRVAVSSSTSGAPAARGELVPSPHPRRSPAICSRASLGGGSAPAGRRRAERVARAGCRARPNEKQSCAAVPAPCPRRRGKGRPPGPVRRRLSGDGAAGPAQRAWFAVAAAGAAAAMPPPSRPRCRSRGSER